MPRAMKTCSCVGCAAHHGGCPEVIPQGTGRCDDCRHAADRARGTAKERGYGAEHRRFRKAVLRRDPICVVCEKAQAKHADHYPLSLRELQARGLDPFTPERGRGVCGPCHSRATAEHQPGGWNAR